MKVVFENAVTEDCKSDLIIEDFNEYVNISIEYTDFLNSVNCGGVNHYLSKEELRQFIGALLHIQSKMRK